MQAAAKETHWNYFPAGLRQTFLPECAANLLISNKVNGLG
jgi:hypothetical protein